MSILNRLGKIYHSLERRNISSRNPELARAFGGLDLGGTLVNPKTAENLSTVLACVGAISSGLASLPAYIYRSIENGREIDDRHAVAHLIATGPNQHQTWADWIEWTMASVLLRGNAVSEIVTDSRGSVKELRPIPFEWCSIQLLPNGRLVYDVSEITSIYGGTGGTRRLLQDEVFHLRDRTDDGLIGKSRLQRAAAVVQAGMSIQTFANALYSNGVNPSGALEIDGHLGHDSFQHLKQQFREVFGGASNAAKALVLQPGIHWKQISINPEDAEFLASRQFTVEELARLFNVPPPIIGDLQYGTFSNVETLLRWFAQNTLSPWIRKIESEFSRSILGASRNTHRLEIDLSGLMRGDPAQRWQAWEIAVKNNILTPDEVRAEEGWNPRPLQGHAIRN
jgi:HK97 family phage portal protein